MRWELGSGGNWDEDPVGIRMRIPWKSGSGFHGNRDEAEVAEAAISLDPAPAPHPAERDTMRGKNGNSPSLEAPKGIPWNPQPWKCPWIIRDTFPTLPFLLFQGYPRCPCSPKSRKKKTQTPGIPTFPGRQSPWRALAALE